MRPVKFKNEFELLTKPTVIQSMYNAITFINASTAITDIVTINNLPLNPGQSLSIEGNNDEIDTTVYSVGMGTSTTASVWVIKKQNLPS